MGSFYKLDPRTSLIKVQDSTGGDPWDSTSWSNEDSTSTQETTFTTYGHRHDVPYVSPLDGTVDYCDWEQIPCIFQCPAGYVAYLESVTITYYVPNVNTNVYSNGDSTHGWRGACVGRFFTTGLPLDTTSTVWAPTNVTVPVVNSSDNPYGIKTFYFTHAGQPLNRPLRAGESLDFRALPFDGPSNVVTVTFTGYLELSG